MRFSPFIAVLGIACTVAISGHAETAKALLRDKTGKDVGTVDLVQTPHGVLLKLSVKGIPAGEHAFHVHAVGKCEPPFTSAGGHFNPGGRKHGMEAADGPHAGDMPNLHVPPSGELAVEVVNPAISLVRGQPNSVFDADGSAAIIHAGADDYKTDPAGNAGDRIACGVIE
ncbi:MAG: superoxide dismutase family protein [Proteobacteria bacterium]|nr:superoxide dismutase family protein [Pseudomonadota bacterium]